jgi:hypothetical protein
MKRISAFVSALALASIAVACSSTDAGITTSVKSKFAADDTVKAYEIDVTTHRGVVTLQGDVDSAAAKEEAVRIARATEGVKEVVDELTVDPDGPEATTGIDIDDTDVDVDVDVDNDAERQADSAGNAVERGAEKTGNAIERGAKATADAAKDAGRRAADAVTDDDRDSDNDGK